MSEVLSWSIAGVVLIAFCGLRIWAGLAYMRELDALPESVRAKLLSHDLRRLY